MTEFGETKEAIWNHAQVITYAIEFPVGSHWPMSLERVFSRQLFTNHVRAKVFLWSHVIPWEKVLFVA